MIVALAVAVVLAVVLTRPDGKPAVTGGELFLEPAGSAGRAPFTESTATTSGEQEPRPAVTAAQPTGTATVATRPHTGDQPGLYGGTRDTASCDVEKQIRVLGEQPAKNAAFAAALGRQPAEVPGYLRSLTPVQLRVDTRVTNHGYEDGRATAYQAVLEAGTAVLVDDRGVPRVRCACGNPLGEPVALKPNSTRHGKPWAAYHPQNTVVIAPAPKTVKKIVIYDHQSRGWYERERGHAPEPDKPVPRPPAPVHPASPPPTTEPAPNTPSPTPTPTPPPTSATTTSKPPGLTGETPTATPSAPTTLSPPPPPPSLPPTPPPPPELTPPGSTSLPPVGAD
ncbi:DUF6777 domain-containing protein [Streptomyces venezuelae]|uniref:DUF6777 domain-containing protein n=1 Tax=Streptomyces venezuelae TaxID=54571 RepID=UPI001CC2696D|nr:DUF6777 domain-containing protein [Streptomyces venezuelae]